MKKGLRKRILALALCGIMAFSGSTSALADSSMEPSSNEGLERGTAIQNAELAHQKYVKDNTDGTYDLTLNVIGSAGTEIEPAKIDVIFVIDTSGSMKRGMNTSSDVDKPNRRIDKLNDAANTAIEAIEAKNDVNANYALVTFASSATTRSNWTTNASNITNNLPDRVNGGTNYEDALLEVESLLNSSTVKDDGATKIVVFLTDGDCTLYNSDSGTAGNGGSYDATAMQKAQTVLGRLTSMNAFYTVGVGPESSYVHLSELNNAVPFGVTTKSYNGTDVLKLKSAFDEIVGSVTEISATNVTVVDTLTEYVDIKEGTSLVVKVEDADGNDVTSTEASAGGIVASYEKDSKQIRLDFNDDYKVKNNYKYSVTAVIEPNEAAEQLYIENSYSYPHTGDENTDAPGNATSSGRKGIFSNTDGGALLTYTTNGTNKSSEYNRPVVQMKTTPVKPPTTEQELTREKYIQYYEESDSYDLTLNVAGQVGSINNRAKVDVVLIVDTSGSMKNDNLTATKSAVNTLMTTLNNKANTIDAQCKVVTFANGSSVKTGEWISPIAAYQLINGWNDDDMNGGTNYQKGLESAATVLKSARSDAQKVVIFLTDGKPTYYGDGPSGLGGETSVNTVNAAYSAAGGITCDQFYAVGINLPGENGIKVYEKDNGYGNSVSYSTSGIAILQNICDRVNAPAAKKGAYNSTSKKELIDIFGKIAGSISIFLCTDVTIRDNLSEFVEVNGNDAKLEIKVTKKVTAEDGTVSEEVVGTSRDGTVASGATLNLEATDTNAVAVLTASYDPELKQVVLDFPDDYELEADYVYYVTVNIIASAKAYSDYAANGGAYNKDEDGNVIKGDEGTDAAGNTTSSKQEGFRSNSLASVTYTYNGTQNSANYDHPVVQVKVKDHSVEKVWVGPKLSSILASLSAKVTIDGSEKAITKSDFSALPDAPQKLSDENNWKHTWVYLPKYYHEDGKVSEITYTVMEEMSDSITDDYSVSYDDTTSGKTIITNTFLKEWQVLKISSEDSGRTLGGAVFELKSTADPNVKFKATSGANGILEWKDSAGDAMKTKDIPTGTYTFIEMEAPTGYSVSEDVWTVVIDKVGAIPIISLGEDEISARISQDGKLYTFTFENDALCDLPSTGGFGIYVPMVSGMLLMLASTLLLLKNKYQMRDDSHI